MITCQIGSDSAAVTSVDHYLRRDAPRQPRQPGRPLRGRSGEACVSADH